MFVPRCLPCLSRALTRGIRKTAQLPYTSEQQCQVLDVLNTSTEHELRKLISPSIVMRIMHQREQKGPLPSLEAMFDINGTTLKSVLKFCDTILNGRQEEKQIIRSCGFTPTIPQERIESLSSVVAVDVTPAFVTYAVMDRNHHLLKLSRIELSLGAGGRDFIPSLYSLAEMIYPKLAHLGDVYIMEQPQSNLQQVTQAKVVRYMLQSILYTMLMFGEPEQPKVVQLKKNVLPNLFMLNLGSERIACEPTVRSLIDKGEITVPAKIIETFDKDTSINREYYGLSILRCLAVLRLCGI